MALEARCYVTAAERIAAGWRLTGIHYIIRLPNGVAVRDFANPFKAQRWVYLSDARRDFKQADVGSKLVRKTV